MRTVHIHSSIANKHCFAVRSFAVGWLTLCLAVAAAPGLVMACIGALPDFPRQLVQNEEKSERDKGILVREFSADGKTWYIPNPAGFADIELRKSSDELAHWERIAAYNLRDNNLAFVAAGGAAPVIPEFSQAHIYIESEQKAAEHRAFSTQSPEQNTPDAALAAAMRTYLVDGTPMSADQFAQIRSGSYAHNPDIFIEKEGQRVMVKFGFVEGRQNEETARAEKEWEEQIAKNRAASQQDGSTAVMMELAPGTSFHTSSYPCIETALVFQNGGKSISLRLEYGPLAKQQDIADAVTTLLGWKANFEKVNR